MGDHYSQSPAKRIRLSGSEVGQPAGTERSLEKKDADMQDSFSRESSKDWEAPEDKSDMMIQSTSKLAGQTIAPFLTKHIPEQYAILGGRRDSTTSVIKDPNTMYCYRHRPDLKCRRQADEPSMDQLQHVSKSSYSDPTSGQV